MDEPAAVISPHPGHGALTPAHLAWDMLAQVGEHADLLPVAARPHVAQALAHLCEAKALVEALVPAAGEVPA